MNEEIEVEYIKDETGKKYPYVDMGLNQHGRVKLWVSMSLIIKNPMFRVYSTRTTTIKFGFPIKGARITKIDDGNFVLRPDTTTTVYHIPNTYRDMSYDILSPEGTEKFEFMAYQRLGGDAVGIWQGVFVNVSDNQPLKYKWHIKDVFYNDTPCGVTIITSDGEANDIGIIPDGLGDIAELPVDKKTE